MRLNVALKVAVIESEIDQNEVARLAKIHVSRLSQIVRGRVTPNRSERLRLAGVLQRPVESLFPESAGVTS